MKPKNNIDINILDFLPYFNWFLFGSFIGFIISLPFLL